MTTKWEIQAAIEIDDCNDSVASTSHDGCGDQADMLDPADCRDPEFFAECEGGVESNAQFDCDELFNLCNSEDCVDCDDDVPF